MSDCPQTWRISGRKSPDKSNFRQTCNLLSQFLKGKGSLGDLNLGITCGPEVKAQTETLCPTTMNLLPQMASSGEVSERNVMDLFPQQAGFGTSSATTEDSRKQSDERPSTEPERAPLTVFYGGKILVFNDIPADKAAELMLMVSKGTVPNPSPASAAGIERGNVPQQHSNPSSGAAAPCTLPAQKNPLSRPAQANVSDLPIARKVSLHRFLEKRKERFAANAPYQTNKESPAPVKPTESRQWLGLGSQGQLNL